MGSDKGTAQPADAVPVQRTVRPLALTARTLKGNSRLHELAAVAPAWDGTWRVRQTLHAVPFAPGKAGPWLYVVPFGVDSYTADKHARWVHESLDEHFGVAAA